MKKCSCLSFLFFLFLFSALFSKSQMKKMPPWNTMEKVFLKASDRRSMYPHEYFPVIETKSFSEIGQLACLSFLQYIIDNPEACVSLPTGRTPKSFIKYLKYYKEHWKELRVQEELRKFGIFSSHFPDTSKLKFIQMSEFYPISSDHPKSFCHFIEKNYLDILGILPENTLLMRLDSFGVFKREGIEAVFPGNVVDFTLLEREATNSLEKKQKQALQEAQAFCLAYEEKIKQWGNLGFIILGIGYDGHIAFNPQGTPKDSITRLVKLNYTSSVELANEVGGMANSINKIGVALGLETMTRNPKLEAIIIATGKEKAQAVKRSIENNKDEAYPIISFREQPRARFYVTKGAASSLSDRLAEDIENCQSYKKLESLSHQVIIDISLQEKIPIKFLTQEVLQKYSEGKAIIRRYIFTHLTELLHEVHDGIRHKIYLANQLAKNKRILHTAPHHDDIALGYYPMMKSLLDLNDNHFLYLTSGFHSVTDSFFNKTLDNMSLYAIEDSKKDLFELSEQQVFKLLHKEENKYDYWKNIIHLRLLISALEVRSVPELYAKIKTLRKFSSMDENLKNRIKGGLREKEAEKVWTKIGVPLSDISHLRASFYDKDRSDISNIQPDISSFISVLLKYKPEIITLAFDPEDVGIDTHFKSLKLAAEGLKKYANPIKVWGYRNVWHKYKLSEINYIIPVKKAEIKEMKRQFCSHFKSQEIASFPLPLYDGVFSSYSEKSMKAQLRQIYQLLGEEEANKILCDFNGVIFIKEMSSKELCEEVDDLSQALS